MNRYILIIACFLAILVFTACGENVSSAENNILQQLVNSGFSIKELAIRTDYTEDELVKAYQSMDDILTDSAKNQKLTNILNLYNEDKIIPVNKTNITAYDCIWQLYNKAQNLPRTSLYTGIGVTRVACALMKRKPLNEDDSIRALVGYVNMKFELSEMPPSIDKYYTKTTILRDVVVPISFHPSVSDETKNKIEYYIYQNEQLELKANENLKKTLDSKINSHISESIDQFVNDDMSSWMNTAKCLFKDSIDEINFYKEKLSTRLALDALNKDVRDEIINYCVSVNCSRAILINEMLNYNDYMKFADVPDRVLLEQYVAHLESLTNTMEKQKQNLGIDAGIMAISIPLMSFTSGAINPSTTMLSIQASKAFVLETLEYIGLDATIKDLFDYSQNEKAISVGKIKIRNKLQSDLNRQMTKSLNGKDSYYKSLNENTKEYYQQVRDYFLIK